MQIKKYNGKRTEATDQISVFYIQCVGCYSGRPLKEPIPNSWEVVTDRSVDFEILSIVFESKILEPFLRGSVIPFLALEDYKRIVFPILENAIHENRIINEHYLQIRKIEQSICNQNRIQQLLTEMKKALSNEVLKKIKANQYENTY